MRSWSTSTSLGASSSRTLRAAVYAARKAVGRVGELADNPVLLQLSHPLYGKDTVGVFLRILGAVAEVGIRSSPTAASFGISR